MSISNLIILLLEKCDVRQREDKTTLEEFDKTKLV